MNRRSKTVNMLLILTMALLMLVTCGPATTNPESTRPSTETPAVQLQSQNNPVSRSLLTNLDGKWVFRDVQVDQATFQLPYGNFAYLLIDGQNVSGSVGCNNFSGTATYDRGNVNFGPLAVTSRACADEAVMAYEAALLDLLDNAAYAGGRGAVSLENITGLKKVQLTRVREETLFVGAEQVDCTGAVPQQCLLVKDRVEDDYTFFYDNIVGFRWEVGFEYELLVEIADIANAPADASALRYELVEVVSKVAE